MDIIEAKTTFGRIVKMVLLCLLGVIFAPLLLLLGYKRLRNIPGDDPNHRLLKYVLIYGVVLTVVLFGFVIWRFMPKSDENLERVTWLPDIAKNVSYYRYPFRCELYEFSVNEDDFRVMYAQETFEGIRESVRVRRFAARIEGRPEEQHTATVKNGLYCSGREVYRTGTYTKEIVYDRDTGRVYFCSEREE
ncbi:MAG: hypothetical protein J6Q65_08820 [Lentisphaeria bacterium]|nr:hypothetical protein [Lentisphaeria bacterium]